MFDLTEIFTYARGLAQTYNIDAKIFLAVYFLSILPFYLGYFLIIHGSTRETQLADVIKFKIKKLKWNRESMAGLFVHLVGRAMPYAYVLLWGENLPSWVYATIFVLFFIPSAFFIRKIYRSFLAIKGRNNDIVIMKKEVVQNEQEISALWGIYDDCFTRLNKLSPCKQSFDREHFVEVLKDSSSSKYLIYNKHDNELVGIGIVSNNLRNSPWISEEYFKYKYPEKFSKDLIYYFMGIAINSEYGKKGYSLALIEKIIDDIPHGSIVGFDHSRNANPFLHYFTHVVKQARSLKREHIDRQHYHIVYRK